MAFEDNRKALKKAAEKTRFLPMNSEAPTNTVRRQARSFTLRPDVVIAINQEAAKQNISASHLVEQILANHFDL